MEIRPVVVIKTLFFAAGIGALTGCAAMVRPAPSSDSTLLIRNVTVIDTRDGNRQSNQDVFIAGGRIVSVKSAAPSVARRSNTQTVDGTGKFLIPGLWDMHAHAYDEASLPLFILNGVTGIRQMNGSSIHYAWRARGIEGTPAAPRTVLASPIVDGSPAHNEGSIEIATAQEARAIVRIVAGSKADFLKVYSKVPREAYLALVDEAHKLGVRVEGHVPDAVSWQEAAALGKQRSFEHLWGLPRWVADNADDLSRRTRAFYEKVTWGQPLTKAQRRRSTALQNEAYDRYDPARFAALVRELKIKQVWQTPTLITWETRIREADAKTQNDPRLVYQPEWMRDWWKGKVKAGGEGTPAQRALSRRRHEFNLARLKEMHLAGVPLLAGSDTSLPYVFPGSSIHEELELMVQAGLPPLAALQTATYNVGLFIEDDTGVIQPGARADLVLLDADPLADIANVRRIDSVVIGGFLMDPAARQQRFAQMQRIAAAPSVGQPMMTAFNDKGLDAALQAFDAHCPAPPEERNCDGGGVVVFELSGTLKASKEKERIGELVAWAETRFINNVDVHVFAMGHYHKLGKLDRAREALARALTLAPGDPSLLQMQAKLTGTN